MIRPLALLALAHGSAAAVGAGEVVVGVHADRATPPQGEAAWAAGGWVSLGLSDAFALQASGLVAEHALRPDEPEDPTSLRIASLAGGLSYALDVLPVVPFLDAQLGALYRRDDRGRTDPQLLVSVGVDWIAWRHGSIGLAAHWHQQLWRGVSYFHGGPRLALRWP
jgi:hypothetical protein